MYKWSEEHPKLWAFLEAVSAFVIGSLLFWVALILPPAALLGLLATSGGLLRDGAGDTIGRFWRAIRRGFLTGLLLFLADVVLGFLLYVDVRFLAAAGGGMGRIFLFALMPVMAVVVMINVYAWPLLAWYPQPFGPLVKRSFFLMGAHPLWALGAVAGVAVAVQFLLLIPGLGYGAVVALGPGVVGAVWAWFAWRVMKRYAPVDEVE